jgi:CRP-like cAMP-binding protein
MYDRGPVIKGVQLIDQLRHDIQQRLDELLAEADRLRLALTALGPAETSARAPASRATTPARARRSKPARKASSRPRAARGATRTAVLSALADGNAMTASQVASATGLPRPSVSTMLSTLVRRGELTKAERGYRVTDGNGPAATAEPLDAAAPADAVATS